MAKISDTGTDFLPRIYVAGREIAKGVAKRKYGGEQAAYQRAMEILAELQTQYPRPDSPLPRMPFYRRPQRTSKHGWSGISRSVKTGFDGGWRGEYFGVAHTNEFGQRTQTAFYVHHYRTDNDALRAAVVFRVEWELDQLIQYEERLREWFAQVQAEPWKELMDLIEDMRAERRAVLASGGRPQPLEAASTANRSQAPGQETAIRPVTRRLNAPQPEDLGLLPDADFILSL